MGLKTGDVITNDTVAPVRNYSVLRVIPVGAQSETVIAHDGDSDVLLKRFLKPKWPSPDRSAKVRELKERGCRNFADRHVAIHEAISRPREGGGNVVLAQDFFRSGAYFHKVYPFVTSVDFPKRANFGQRLVLARTLAGSVADFAAATIVHGDLKPENVLVEARGDLFVAKVIDYDDAYFESSPPAEPVGSFEFASPELRAYWAGASDRAPMSVSDAYSLGLTLHALLLGSAPYFDRDRHEWFVDAALAGEASAADPALGALAPVIDAMLSPSAADRPSIQDIVAELAKVPIGATDDGVRTRDGRGGATSTDSMPPAPRSAARSERTAAVDPSRRPQRGSNLRRGRVYRPR